MLWQQTTAALSLLLGPNDGVTLGPTGTCSPGQTKVVVMIQAFPGQLLAKAMTLAHYLDTRERLRVQYICAGRWLAFFPAPFSQLETQRKK